MSTKVSRAIAGGLLLAGAIASAGAKWYLVWLAQAVGGPQELGTYGLLFAVATPAFVVAQLGLRTIFLSMRTAYPWRSYLAIRAVGLAAGTAAILVFVSLSPTIPARLGIAVVVLKLCDSILDLEIAKVQYAGNIRGVGLLTLAGAILSIAFASLAIVVTSALWLAVLASALAALAISAITRKMATTLAYNPDTTESGIGAILGAALPVTGAQLLASLLLYIPTLYLGTTATLSDVGIFVGIAYVLTIADVVGSSISKLLITPLRHLQRESGPAVMFRELNKWTAQVALAATGPAAALVLFGSWAFQFVYGSQFETSRATMAIFSAGAFFIVVSHVQSVGLNVMNRYYSVVVSFGAACLMALLAGLVLTLLSLPPLAVGAGIAAMGAFGRAAVLFGSAAWHAKKSASHHTDSN